MSVRQSLLAILAQGACYGSQLRAEFDRRTGSTWPLNVGQISHTLERLERDGLVARAGADRAGHVLWRATDAGTAVVAAWLRTPVERPSGTRDELAVKLAVATTLPGVDAAEVIALERAAAAARLDELRLSAEIDAQAPEEFARSLLLDSLVFAAEAELRWLDHLDERLAAHPRHAFALGLSTDRPRRGRPARAAAPASPLPPPTIDARGAARTTLKRDLS